MSVFLCISVVDTVGAGVVSLFGVSSRKVWGRTCLEEEEEGAADPFNSLFSPSRPMEPEIACQRIARLSSGTEHFLFLPFLLHDRSSSRRRRLE